MMRLNKFVGGLALALLLCATTQVRANEETKGTIKSVNTTRNEVVLKGVVKDTIYELDKKASVWVDGTAAKLGELKADDRAIVVYEKRGEHFMAQQVRVLRNSQEVAGTVRTVASTERKLILKGTIKDTTYELTKNARIWINGKEAAVADLREGDAVLITYRSQGEQMIANDVSVRRAK